MIEKWRYLVEPVLNNAVAPIAWDLIKSWPLIIFEGQETVLFCLESELKGGKSLQIIAGAGKMNEINQLYEQAETYAKQHGYKTISYVGRKGWLKTHGFKIEAVVGMKEL